MADLKLTVQEQLILNGLQQGGSYTTTISNINDVYKRVVTLPATSSATLASFKSTVATGSISAMDLNDVKYIRITNLSATDTPLTAVNLGIQVESGNDDSSADKQATVKLEAKRSFMIGSTTSSIDVDDGSGGVFSSLSNIESIIAISSGSVQLEVFIAST